MKNPLKIGTRESELATWQATHVQRLLKEKGIESELVFIKSEGDINTVTPLYELGVQGIFTKTLDAALLSKRIDIAVHSMKDVPTEPAAGIRQAAVLKRASYKDILVFKGGREFIENVLNFNPVLNIDEARITGQASASGSRHPVHPTGKLKGGITIGTSSIRRKAQWLHRYPDHLIESLRGNVNTRLQKLNESHWNGVIFAAAGLERIGLRPPNSIDLDWMLPAPAQGAITISCRSNDDFSFNACQALNHQPTELCTGIERDFLRALQGGCSTPISALAVIDEDVIHFRGNICSVDGKQKVEIQKNIPVKNSNGSGIKAADELLQNEEAKQITNGIRNAK